MMIGFGKEIEEAYLKLHESFVQTAADAITLSVEKQLEQRLKKDMVICYTEVEAAERLKIGKRTLEELRKAGFIKHFRVSGMVRYRPDHIEEFIRSNEYPQRKKKL